MPLARAYRRLAALCPALRLTLAAPDAEAIPTPAAPAHPAADPEAGAAHGPGWVDGRLLAHDAAARQAWLDAEAARIRSVHGVSARADVVATKALHGYLWSAALLISGPWYLERRVPYLRPQDVQVGPGGSYRVVPGEFACLPGDPAAADARATVRGREEDLHVELRRAVADHVGPLLDALRPRLRRGARALWGMVGDDLVSGLWHLGRALGEEERGAEQATRVLPAPLAPFPGGARFRRLPEDRPGPDRLTRTRIGCCLHYTVRGDEICATCPRLRALAPRTAERSAEPPAPRPAQTIRL